MIKFGPAGIGPVRNIKETFESYKRLGIRAAEIPFTYSVFIRDEKTAHRVKNAAEKFGISLSIHAQYWINLNSKDRKKVEKSKERILECLEVGTWLGAKVVVFHPGYYNGFSKQESYENIKREILDIEKIRKEKKFTPKLAPETTGKVNVFGSLKEIKELVEETGSNFCIDFSHVLARYKTYNFNEVKKLFYKHKKWHCHFSGIEYGKKGEKKHVKTKKSELKRLIRNLPKDKEITIINESPSPVKDTIKGIEIYKGSK